MATSFNKSLKTITVKTIGGNTINCADTVQAMNASAALSEFEIGKTMLIRLNGNLPDTVCTVGRESLSAHSTNRENR